MEETIPLTEDRVRFEDAETGFSAVASPDFELAHGPETRVYKLTSAQRGLTFHYARLGGVPDPLSVAAGSARRSGLSVVSAANTEGWARLEAETSGGHRWAVEAQRDDTGTVKVVMYGRVDEVERTPEQELDDHLVLATLSASARGGTMIPPEPPPSPAPEPARAPEPEASEPPAVGEDPFYANLDRLVRESAERASRPFPGAPPPPEFPAPIPLKPYKDEQVSGKVPDEPGWTVQGGGGMLFAEHPERGELWLGLSTMVTIPGGQMDQMMRGHGLGDGGVTAPVMSAEQAVNGVWIPLRNKYSPNERFAEVEITGRDHMTGSQWGSSGVFQIRLPRGGKPWRGAVQITTTHSPMDYYWRCYMSSILVPQDGDGRVWMGLLGAWAAFRPGKQASAFDREMRQIQIDADKYVFGVMEDING